MAKKAVKITILILLAVLLLGAVAVPSLVYMRKYSEQIDKLESDNSSLSESQALLEKAKAELEAEKKALEDRLSELEANLEDAGAYYSDEIASLKSDISAKQDAITALESDIAKYRTVFNIDVLAQSKLIGEIVDYINSSCPVAKKLNEDGTHEWVPVTELVETERAAVDADQIELFTEEELAASGLTSEEFTELKLRERVFAREDVEAAKVSIYYEDLATGYHFDHNADVAYNSASVVKAPYVMSVLKAVSADEKAFMSSLAEGEILPETVDSDGDGEPDRIKIEYSDPKYDLFETVVYDSKTMYRQGSGVICTMDDGTEFTYLDFVKYTLEESDNVAYAQLRSRYGYDTMYSLASSVGANIAGSTMTAKGAGKLFKAIYEFIESDETYGSVMADSMKKANHTVIIPLALYGKTVLHKYGWDTGAYHDAGIVLAKDHPYVITVFTDLEQGGDSVNAYLREIVKMLDRLHSGFYAN